MSCYFILQEEFCIKLYIIYISRYINLCISGKSVFMFLYKTSLLLGFSQNDCCVLCHCSCQLHTYCCNFSLVSSAVHSLSWYDGSPIYFHAVWRTGIAHEGKLSRPSACFDCCMASLCLSMEKELWVSDWTGTSFKYTISILPYGSFSSFFSLVAQGTPVSLQRSPSHPERVVLFAISCQRYMFATENPSLSSYLIWCSTIKFKDENVYYSAWPQLFCAPTSLTPNRLHFFSFFFSQCSRAHKI